MSKSSAMSKDAAFAWNAYHHVQQLCEEIGRVNDIEQLVPVREELERAVTALDSARFLIGRPGLRAKS